LKALRKLLILRRPRSGRLEGRTTLIQTPVNFLTASIAGKKAGFRSLGDAWADTTTAHGV